MPPQKAMPQGSSERRTPKTLIIPDRRGNKLADGHLNVLKTGRVGLIFLVPNTRETLRINGQARLTADPDCAGNFFGLRPSCSPLNRNPH